MKPAEEPRCKQSRRGEPRLGAPTFDASQVDCSGVSAHSAVNNQRRDCGVGAPAAIAAECAQIEPQQAAEYRTQFEHK
jgi:hypothetical protein